MQGELRRYGLVLGRVLVAVIFLLNGFGVIDQTGPVEELARQGVPSGIASAAVWGGRILQVVAGAALLLGFQDRWAALALCAFLVPATLAAHRFWAAPGDAIQGQLTQFAKNLAMLGGLLCIACRETRAAVPLDREEGP